MSNPWSIIVAERGWIYAGRTHRDGDRVVIEDAYVVRRFSLETKDGLGMLADRAPKKDNDVLDPAPRSIRVYMLAIVADFDCNQDAWSKWHEAKKRSSK